MGLAFDVNHRENLIGIELADLNQVIVEVGGKVVARDLELAVGEQLQDAVIALESAQILASLVGIEAAYGVVVPEVTRC